MRHATFAPCLQRLTQRQTAEPVMKAWLRPGTSLTSVLTPEAMQIPELWRT